MSPMHSEHSASTLIALSDSQKSTLLTAVREAALVRRAQADENASETFTASAEHIPVHDAHAAKRGRSKVDSVQMIDLSDSLKEALWSAVLEARRDAIAYRTVVEFQPELSFQED